MNLKDVDCVMDEPSGNVNDSGSQNHMLVLLFWFFQFSLRLASLDSDAGTDSRLAVVRKVMASTLGVVEHYPPSTCTCKYSVFSWYEGDQC